MKDSKRNVSAKQILIIAAVAGVLCGTFLAL